MLNVNAPLLSLNVFIIILAEGLKTHGPLLISSP